MDLKELKKELSKISGVDMFNPKFREVWKRYEGKDEDTDKAEEEKPVDEQRVNEKVEDIDKAEDEREIDKIEEEKADDGEKKDDKKEEVNEESEEIGKEVDELKDEKGEKEEIKDYDNNDLKDELLDSKIELALLHNGVRPENLEKAKKYTKYEVRTLEDLDKVNDVLADFPEWVRDEKPKGFGMEIKRDNEHLTPEERRMKELGIVINK